MYCVHCSLFQKYRLYKLLFTTPREELQTSMEVRDNTCLLCVCVCVCVLVSPFFFKSKDFEHFLSSRGPSRCLAVLSLPWKKAFPFICTPKKRLSRQSRDTNCGWWTDGQWDRPHCDMWPHYCPQYGIFFSVLFAVVSCCLSCFVFCTVHKLMYPILLK